MTDTAKQLINQADENGYKKSHRARFWNEHCGLSNIHRLSVNVCYPRMSDPRLIQISVLLVGTLLGQSVFGFEVNAGQILLSVGTCVILDMFLAYRQERALIFPASGLISGLSLALLLRVHEGQWQYLIYVIAGAVAILSKYWIRRGGSHVYNPSNLALALVLGGFGSVAFVTPQQWHKSWWLATLFIVCGLMVTYRARVLSVAAAFVAVETTVILIGKASDSANLEWLALWTGVASTLLTPALLVFTFFMVTDPRTVPPQLSAKIIFASSVALLHQLLLSFGIGNSSLFYALFLVCSVILFFDSMPGTKLHRSLAPTRSTARPVA